MLRSLVWCVIGRLFITDVFPDQFFIRSGIEKIRTFSISTAGKPAVGRTYLIAVFVKQYAALIATYCRNKINLFAIIFILIY